MNKKISRFFAFALCTLVLVSCGKYNYNEPVTKDEMAGNERIWGAVDGPPRQVANTYPADPELAAKSSALREKMFYDDWGMNTNVTGDDFDTDAPTQTNPTNGVKAATDSVAMMMIDSAQAMTEGSETAQ